MQEKPLTAQQSKVLNFVAEFLRRNGFPPTLREIGEAIGLSNVNAVRGHVTALEKKGYVARSPDKARSIRIVRSPSAISRVKRKLHEAFRTDDGVLHRVIYGLAWTTRDGAPLLAGQAGQRLSDAIDREAVEHGWEIAERRIDPDHVVVVVRTWPNHSAQQTVRRLQSLGRGLQRQLPAEISSRSIWGRGYVATTDLEQLDELVAELRNNQGADQAPDNEIS